MTLGDYLKVFRQRWLVIAICTIIAAAVMYAVTPATPSARPAANSYTATATLLVGTGEGSSSAQMGRIPLYLTTGEIPRRAAAKLGYTGDPAVLASSVTVTPDFSAAALTVSFTAPDGDRAAEVANAFAEETVAFFKKPQAGTGKVSISILQQGTPIPSATERGGFVVPPGRTARTLFAAGLGLLFGLALALVLERLDSRLRSREEIAAAMGLPIVAEVPKMKRALRGHPAIGVVEHPLSPFADAYRAARTALVHTASLPVAEADSNASAVSASPPHTSRSRVVLITSAYPSEGKTTSVANLAASFAETGQRVLVLDADLRSPGTHTYFDVPQGAGISDYVSRPEDSSLEALMRPTNVEGVRIITAGTRLAHPASLASRMGALIEEVRHLADVVLIDTAPLLLASDVFDLLPLVDTVLIVVRNGRITEVDGRRVSELLGRFQVPVTGALVVGAKSTRGYGGYGGGYGYGEQKRRRGRVPGDGAPADEPTEDVEGAAPLSRSDRRRLSA